MKLYNSFNTSYVSVQEKGIDEIIKALEFQYILCVGSSSAKKVKKGAAALFQYILCVGSSNAKLGI